MIDQNRDGFIDKEDLKDMLASLGKLVVTPVSSEMLRPKLRLHAYNTIHAIVNSTH